MPRIKSRTSSTCHPELPALALGLCEKCYDKQQRAQYYLKNKDKWPEKFKRTWRKLMAAIYEKFNSRCNKCGFSDRRALQIDHVLGDGNRERRELKNRLRFLRMVLTDTESRYQLLCANCNWIKRYENNEGPKNSKGNLMRKSTALTAVDYQNQDRVELRG